eukprot:PITA_23837
MNRTIQQMAHAMLDEFGTPATFWGEAAFTAVTILSQANVQVNSTQTPHELWYGKIPTVKYFKVFGRKCYIKRTNEKLGKFEPRADEDVDWVGSVDDRESISGGTFYMDSKLVSWFNKKQISIALSAAEAKYVAAASCCTQLLWMMQTLQDIQITCIPPISILSDKTSAICISKNPAMHSKTKHIPIKYHFLHEQRLEENVKLEYVPSKEQVADIFTKRLPRETFEYLRKNLGVVSTSSCC